MFPLPTQGGMSSVFSLYFSINFSSPHQCGCGLIHSLHFSWGKKSLSDMKYFISVEENSMKMKTQTR